MNSKFYATTVVLCVHLFIHKVITEDDLQFWERDPKFDSRRIARNKNNNTEIINQKLSYNHEKPIKQTPDDHLEAIVKPNFRAKVESNKTVASRWGKASGRQTKEVVNIPMLRSKKARGKAVGRQQDDDHMSTRIVPDVEPQKQPKKWWWFSDSKNDTKEEDRFVLSPYSIADQLKQIISKMPEANLSTEVLGRTAEYNDIVLLKVTEHKSEIDKYFRADDSRYVDETPEKKIIFIVHGLSAMGINQMSVFKHSHYFSKLLSYYFAHLDKFDVFIIPMANPDGYAYAMNHVGFSYWNKNLSPQNGCAGVALDRNFDVAWNASESVSTCSQRFPGTTPFSEPESKAIRDVLHRYSHKIIAYMHVHPGTYDAETYKGDAILYPRGYSDAQSDDDKYIDLKGEIDESIKNASFKYLSVTVDTLQNWYGTVYGTSVDYASTVYGIPYSLELVMQIYEQDDQTPVDPEKDLENIALEQIWARVIDVLFKSIWKNMHMNDVQ